MVGHWKNDAFYYGEFQRSDGTLISGKWTRESLSEGKVRDEFGNIFTGVFNEKGGIRRALTSCKPRCLYREILNNLYHGKAFSQNRMDLVCRRFVNGEYSGLAFLP